MVPSRVVCVVGFGVELHSAPPILPDAVLGDAFWEAIAYEWTGVCDFLVSHMYSQIDCMLDGQPFCVDCSAIVS